MSTPEPPPEGMPAPVAKRLGYALKRAQHELRKKMDEALRPSGMTTPQYAVLCAIEAAPGLSNARLARAAFVTAQTMQAILANLERDSLLARRPDATHGRVLRNELTPRGRRMLGAAHTAVRVVEDRMVETFGDDAAHGLSVALTRCAEDLAAMPPLDAEPATLPAARRR